MSMHRATMIEFSGHFTFGVAEADPAMAPDGSLIPNIAVAVHEDQNDETVDVVMVFTENGVHKLIAALQAQLNTTRGALVVPAGARR